tara:strand:+ start:687 stop:917 length:231 start_codon:yes stop_codon:yes gene_type:complete
LFIYCFINVGYKQLKRKERKKSKKERKEKAPQEKQTFFIYLNQVSYIYDTSLDSFLGGISSFHHMYNKSWWKVLMI